jgi:hypothetical protein
MAVVETSNAGNGIIWCWPRPVALFDEISDYEVTAIADGDVPMYSGNKYVNTNLGVRFADRDVVSGTVRQTFDLLYDSAVSNYRLTNADGYKPSRELLLHIKISTKYTSYISNRIPKWS